MRIVHVINDLATFFSHRRALIDDLAQSHDVEILAPRHQDLQSLRVLGYRVWGYPVSRKGINPFTELLTLWSLYRLYLHLQPDLVHHFTIKPVIYGTVAARLAGVPRTVNTITGLGYVFTGRGLLPKLLRPLVQRLYRWSFSSPRTKVIFQNQDDLKLFLDHGLITPAKTHLIPGSGVDTKRFFPAPAESKQATESQPQIRVLLPARMLWDKGIGEYVEAARRLRPKYANLRFELAGGLDANNRMAISEEQLRQWQSEGDVQWLGKVQDMAKLLREVDIVCLPSYREGLPMALLEAAAAGKAIVTTDAPGCRELIRHEVDGLLVPVANSGALAQAIERLLIDHTLRQRLAQSARSRAEHEFSTSHIATLIRQVYEVAWPSQTPTP